MVALRGNETNCEWQSQTANQADYQAVNKHFIKNNHSVTHKRNVCYSVFQLRLNAIFGVKEKHMHLEAFTALRKVLLYH